MAPEESAIATILTLLAAREMICLCRGEATTYKKHQLATSSWSFRMLLLDINVNADILHDVKQSACCL